MDVRRISCYSVSFSILRFLSSNRRPALVLAKSFEIILDIWTLADLRPHAWGVNGWQNTFGEWCAREEWDYACSVEVSCNNIMHKVRDVYLYLVVIYDSRL